jgi:hypothetical protein
MMAATIWTDLVGRYFQAAALALDPTNLKSGSFDQDRAAIKAVSAKDQKPEDRARILSEWVMFYRAHRVVVTKSESDKKFALAAATSALPVLDRLTDSDIPGAFVQLRGAIAQALDPGNDRKASLIFLTSKILWCKFPEAAPVYEQFAANATCALVKILKTLEGKEPYRRAAEERRYDDKDGYQVWDSSDKKMVDCWFYKDYVESRSALYRRCQAEIVRQIAVAGPSIHTASPFQVFDKILWMFGDHNLDYSLKGSRIA